MSQELASSVVSTETPAVASTQPVAAPITAQPEKTFTQADVDKFVHERTSEVKTRTEARMRSEFEAKQQSSQAPTAGTSSVIDAEMVRKVMLEEAEKIRYEGAYNHALGTFNERINAAVTGNEYPDFKETVQCLNDESMTPIAVVATMFDNTADIIYHLGKNSFEAANILKQLEDPRTSRYAQAKIAEISNQLRMNKEAKKAPVANAPLSQITPSNNGIDSGSTNPSISERRLKPSLRF